MSIPPRDFAIELSIPDGRAEEITFGSDRLEDEVIGLFDQFRTRLLRYVLAFGVPVHDSEEIIQDVFLALFRHLQQGRSCANLRGWIFRVAHNLALKRLEANQRLQLTLESNEAVAASRMDQGPNPEELMQDSQRQKLLCAVLRALPRRDRCCLYLRAEGLRYREIAEVLGISLGAVSISITKSLQRLERADEG